MQATSLARIDTEYSADCIEWCPSPGYEDIFVCGTYQVIEPNKERNADTITGTDGDNEEPGDEPTAPAATQRTGRLLLFHVDPGDNDGVTEVQRLDTNAILDAKWFKCGSIPKLAVADAKGQISIYTLTSAKRLELEQAVQVAGPSVLVLSLDISLSSDSGGVQIAYSVSNGSLGILSAVEGQWEVEQSWHGHDFEPWCIAWDKWNPYTIWSGGDDLKLKRWDNRDTSSPTFTNSRYEAGITTITSSPHTPHLLAVGSYDSHLRIYDTRSPRQVVQEINVGGGVWRAKFHPDPKRGGEMLLATMHDGFKVVKLNLSSKDCLGEEGNSADAAWSARDGEIIKQFDKHTSLAYGADWSRLPTDGEGTLVATCSFYDHTMHLWRG